MRIGVRCGEGATDVTSVPVEYNLWEGSQMKKKKETLQIKMAESGEIRTKYQTANFL
jgi:hypothetical protein